MSYLLTQFANTEPSAESGGLFVAIGVDWKLLVLQTVAFLILLWVLKKFVYPPLVAMLDKHDAKMAEAATAARDAEKKAAASKAETEKLLKEARQQAAGIVSTAKNEASELVARAEDKSKAHAEAIVAAAKADIQKEIVAAKKALHNETVALVAAATEKVAGATVSAQADDTLIKQALKEVR